MVLVSLLILTLALPGSAQYLHEIVYDDGISVYYSGRPQPNDTVGVWFEPPSACRIVSARFQISSNSPNTHGQIYIWDLRDDFDPALYYDNDEPGGGPGPLPFAGILAGPINYTFLGNNQWEVINFSDYGYPPSSLDVGTNPFFVGYVLSPGNPNPFDPSLLGDASDSRPYHSLAWLTNPGGIYTGQSGWYAYGIDWLLRATVDIYGDPPPVISDLADPPDTYTAGPYTITATITDEDSAGQPSPIAVARLIFDTTSGPADTVLMTNTGGNTWSGQIPTVWVGQTITFRVEALDANGGLMVSPNPDGYNFTYRIPGGSPTLLVNDSGNDYLQDFYANALGNAGYSYDYWYIAPGEEDDMGYPGSDVFSPAIYDHIIWFTGTAHPGSLPDNNANLAQDPVAQFMTGGGNFFLSSSDYLGAAFEPDIWSEFTAPPGTFMYEYLKVANGWSDSHLNAMGESTDTVHYGVSGDPVGGEYVNPFQSHPSPNYNDFANPRTGASTCFRTQIGNESAGIRYQGTYRMVFLPWVLEACDDSTIAAGILANTLEYFGEFGSPVVVNVEPAGMPLIFWASGGTCEVIFTIENVSSSPQTFDAWSRARLPDMTWTTPLLGPFTMSLPAGVTITKLRYQTVPAYAPAGSYLYQGLVGNYPSNVWYQSNFPFIKLAAADGSPWVNDWNNWGDSFTIGDPGATPAHFSLAGAHPNPFNPTTTISFSLPAAGKVTLAVFDLQGRIVATLVDGRREAGSHQAVFDGTGLPSGLYLYRLQAGERQACGKMALVK